MTELTVDAYGRIKTQPSFLGRVWQNKPMKATDAECGRCPLIRKSPLVKIYAWNKIVFTVCWIDCFIFSALFLPFGSGLIVKRRCFGWPSHGAQLQFSLQTHFTAQKRERNRSEWIDADAIFILGSFVVRLGNDLNLMIWKYIFS